MKGGNLYRRMNVMDDRNDLMMVVNLLNRNCALRDLKTGASLGVNRGHRMNGLLDDLNLDVSRGHRMSDRLDDQNLDVSRVNRRTGVHLNAQLVYEHRVDLTIDPECYVRRDRKMGENSDVKNLHVMYY